MDLEERPLGGAALRALRGALRGRHRALKADFGGVAFDGHVFPLMVENGEIAGAVAVGVDAGEAHSAVLFLSTHDPLTGLLNRHQLLEALNHYADPGAAGGALVLFDIDRFAQINEIAGHAAGDELLCAIADRMRFLEIDGHYVARLGSDEFACLLIEPKDAAVVERRIEQLRDALDAPFKAGHAEFVLRTTMGVA